MTRPIRLWIPFSSLYGYELFVESHEVRVGGCPEMGSNTSSRAANINWTSYGFMEGRGGVLLAAKQMRSHKDRVYHKTYNIYNEEQ